MIITPIRCDCDGCNAHHVKQQREHREAVAKELITAFNMRASTVPLDAMSAVRWFDPQWTVNGPVFHTVIDVLFVLPRSEA